MKEKSWGWLLSMDLHECDYSLLVNRKKIKEFCHNLCKEIGMVQYGKPIIKRFGKGKLKGYSFVQFIDASSINAHLDEFGLRAFIDVFSCKPFDFKKAVEFSKSFFKAKKVKYKNFSRY